MALNIASVKNARYYPEILPDTQIKTVVAGNIDYIVDLRRFAPKWVIFKDFASQNSLGNFLRIINDRISYDIDTFDLKASEPNPFDVIGKEFLSAQLNATAGVVDFLMFYNLIVFEPTVAHKILNDIPLTAEEMEIDAMLNIQDDVKKGLLPLNFDYILQREYQLIDGRRTFTYADGAATAAGSTVNTHPALENEIVVLESINAATLAPIAQNVRIVIDRDDDTSYLELPVNAFNFAGNVDLKCFVPALREIRIRAFANTPQTTQLHYTIAKYKLNDILKVRFGLAIKGEVPDDIWYKVKAGVL